MKYLRTLSRYAGCSGSMHDGDGKGADGRSNKTYTIEKSTNLKFYIFWILEQHPEIQAELKLLNLPEVSVSAKLFYSDITFF